MDADGKLSQAEESELYRHYGLDYSERSDRSGTTTDRDRDAEARGTVGHDGRARAPMTR